MTKYRIIEFRQRNGVVYYSVQKSFLYFFWVYITEIRDISMASYRKTYKTFEEARNEVMIQIDFKRVVSNTKIVSKKVVSEY